jgi:hypothetical protein
MDIDVTSSPYQNVNAITTTLLIEIDPKTLLHVLWDSCCVATHFPLQAVDYFIFKNTILLKYIQSLYMKGCWMKPFF